MKEIGILVAIALMGFTITLAARTIQFTNKCPYTIWISPLTNAQGPMLAPGIARVNSKASFTYQIPDNGWAGRFWPKSGCDGSGQNCEMGQSIDPCGPKGCDPPADTKVEFFFPRSGVSDQVWYDISLVDGYSLPSEIIPSIVKGTCVKTKCAVSLAKCPRNEKKVNDLLAVKNGKPVYCLAPCKKWNYPSPYGMGKPETEEPGLHYCCPTPPIQPADCRSGSVVQTDYVKLVHRDCPSAYSYSYDDEAGLHNCDNNVSFKVSFC